MTVLEFITHLQEAIKDGRIDGNSVLLTEYQEENCGIADVRSISNEYTVIVPEC